MKSLGFFEGMRYPLLGLKHLLAHRELWPYAIRAFVVGISLFIVLAVFAAVLLLDVPGTIFEDGFNAKSCLLGCLALLLGVVGGVVLFALIGNVVAGPYLEAMTERMMADAGRLRETPRGYWAAFWPGLRDQAGRFLIWAIVQSGLLVTWVTPAAFLYPLGAWGVSIFFVALEAVEYPLEALGLRFFPRIEWGLKRLPPVLGFGTTLFFLMPVAGFIFLPAAVCGAVLLEEEMKKSQVPGPESSAGPPSGDRPASP